MLLLEALRPLTQEQFNYSQSGKWSIQQILAHLVTAERLTLQYMKKKVLGINEAENSGLLEALKITVLRISQRLPLKFKAPKVVVENTVRLATVDELIVAWEKERNDLREFLETFKQDQLRKNIYKHVLAGKMNIQHALIFAREHVLHHRPQVQRILASFKTL